MWWQAKEQQQCALDFGCSRNTTGDKAKFLSLVQRWQNHNGQQRKIIVKVKQVKLFLNDILNVIICTVFWMKSAKDCDVEKRWFFNFDLFLIDMISFDLFLLWFVLKSRPTILSSLNLICLVNLWCWLITVYSCYKKDFKKFLKLLKLYEIVETSRNCFEIIMKF